MHSLANSKNLCIACFLFLLLFTLFSCEQASLPGQLEAPAVQAEINEPLVCDIGQQRWFNLNVQNGPPYQVSIPNTPLYNFEDNCMCNTTELQLVFDELPMAGDIHVTGQNGDVIPFLGPFPISIPGSTEEFILIDHSVLQPVITVDFTDTQPQMTQSGGFCVIDNLSGPNPTGSFTAAFYTNNPTTMETEVWLPVVATFPM